MLWLEKERNYTDEELNIVKIVEDKYSVNRFIASLIAERNEFNLDEIEYFLSTEFKPISPFGLKDMKKAVEIIYKHMSLKNKIMAVIDYDLDGCNAGYILTNLFKALGYPYFEVYMPHRQKESYGLSVQIVELAFEKGVKLIITADNGIAAFAAIDRAKELGIEVVVTDHHEVQTIINENGDVVYNLPKASAIVNPHRHDCEYPYKMLSGGGVAYKLSQAMIMCAPEEIKRNFISKGYNEKIISSAAISAIGDIMKILGENRALVKQALKYLEKGSIPAVKAIMDKPSVMGISYGLAPNLSSVGRLSDMNKSLQFMLEEDEAKIQEMLPVINEYNEIRKNEQEAGIQKALEILQGYDVVPDIIVEILEDVRPTVLGLVAGKIKEKVHRPVIFFSKANNGKYKGSGRSIESYNLFGEIEPLLGVIEGLDGGGHPGACGLNAANESVICELREQLHKKCSLTEYEKTPKVYIDKYLTLRDDFMKMYNDLKLLEPFDGISNTNPIFAIKDVYLDFEFKKHKHGEFAVIELSDNLEDDFSVNAICWDEDVYLKDGKKVFDVAKGNIIVGIEINSYTKRPQLNIKSIQYKE